MRDSSLNWQKILAQGFNSANDLLHYLSLPDHFASQKAELLFKTRVPRGFAARMQKGNPNDPLLLQVLAIEDETKVVEGFVPHPLVEAKSNPVKGLLHKYEGRVLLTFTGSCAINCRYCFRRHFPYQDNNPGRAGWQEAIDYIHQDSSIHEVILSGGDPLLATDSLLKSIIKQLETIPHLKILRFHTRIPIVLPERIDQGLLQILAESILQKVVVMHANHAQEINEDVREACKNLKRVGCELLNQSVLLKGINDSVGQLKDLSYALFSCGILPYYLHLLDKVEGAGHFDLPEEKALTLYRQLQTQLPGYLLPRLAREVPGEKHKMLFI